MNSTAVLATAKAGDSWTADTVLALTTLLLTIIFTPVGWAVHRYWNPQGVCTTGSVAKVAQLIRPARKAAQSTNTSRIGHAGEAREIDLEMCVQGQPGWVIVHRAHDSK